MSSGVTSQKIIFQSLKRQSTRLLPSLSAAATKNYVSSAVVSASPSIRHYTYHQKPSGNSLKVALSCQNIEYNHSLLQLSRSFSDKHSDEEETKKENNNEEQTSDNGEEKSDEEEGPSEVEKLQAEVKNMKDQLLRSLAEQENIRRIAKKDVDNARAFAITSFAKSLLDTSDNLTRALDAVPEEYREDKENHAVLATLFEGIQMTDDGLTKAFAKNGLTKFGAVGDKFDPNMHEALFEYPDANMEAGTIGQVMKVGFSLKERVIRPAEVGVVKSP